MLNLQDINYEPSLDELKDCFDFSVFNDLCQKMQDNYQALVKIEFSRCTRVYGSNIKFKKAGKTLCIVYPHENYILTLVIIG